MHRRQILAVIGTVTSSALGGCFFGIDSTGSGKLVVSNNQGRTRSLSITVQKTNGADDAEPRNRSKTPTETPIWSRTKKVEMQAGETRREPEFITEPGTYHISVEVEEERAATWFGLYSAGREGEQVAGGYVFISIYGDGRLGISTPVDD